jgi:anaerobic ribonucleoside-triphosphate reductase activating protein
MKLAISRLHYPVTALGPGHRVGIWLQGCSINCPGCASRDTWQRTEQSLVEVDRVLQWCADLQEPIDGVTISGGEPFEQADALLALLQGLERWRRSRASALDILCYSGLPWRRIQRDHAPVLALLDAIVPEPFVEGLPTDARWRGSANQPLIALSELGALRFGGEEEADKAEARMQITVEDGKIWFIGVPRRGDLDRMLEAAAARGVVTGGASWRS